MSVLPTQPAELIAPECRTCGACCSLSPEWPRFSLENDADLDRIPHAYVDGDLGRMRCGGDHCAALVGDVGISAACAIYTMRPAAPLRHMARTPVQPRHGATSHPGPLPMLIPCPQGNWQGIFADRTAARANDPIHSTDLDEFPVVKGQGIPVTAAEKLFCNGRKLSRLTGKKRSFLDGANIRGRMDRVTKFDQVVPQRAASAVFLRLRRNLILAPMPQPRLR